MDGTGWNYCSSPSYSKHSHDFHVLGEIIAKFKYFTVLHGNSQQVALKIRVAVGEFSSIFIYKRIVGLNQKYIKTTAFPNQNIYHSPPQVAVRADPDPTTTFPNLGGWLHGEILISFAQKLNETLHSNQSGNHLLQTFTSRISFWCASCLISISISLNLTQVCIFKNTMPRRFARAGFLEDPGMHPAQMNGALGKNQWWWWNFMKLH